MSSHHEDLETTNFYSTPKLTLSKLPNKPRNNIPLATPPLHPSVSIPFQWEEAPGKPKSPSTKSKTVRSLDLPPRLLNEAAKVTNTPSPTTVLDGPYIGRSFSSFEVALVGEVEMDRFKKKLDMSGHNKDMKLGSWRWETFKVNKGIVKDSFDFSGPLSSTSSVCDYDKPERKLLRFRRKGSFLGFSRSDNSNLLGGIYESLKQAVPWRWRRAKSNKRAN